jgi:Bacterial TSP3 repeat
VKHLLKRFLITALTLQVLLYGGNSAWADGPAATTQDQSSEIDIEQSQGVNTEGTADEINQDQDAEDEVSQDANETPNSGTLEQTTEIDVSQNQTITESDQLDAEQDLETSLESGQSQQINHHNQDQNTKVTTDQDQTISTEDSVKSAEQNQNANIKNEQTSVVDPNKKVQNQDTTVTLEEKQGAVTSGNTVLEQNQSVEATGQQNGKPDGQVKANTSNRVEITKDVEKTIIKIYQLIFINDEKTEEINNEYVLDENPINETQEHTYNFSWGTLYLSNKAKVSKTQDDQVESLLESLITLNFKARQVEYLYEETDSDGDGLSNDEEYALGTDPNNPDTDKDGLNDYVEVRIFKTNPLSTDTDGDMLSDYFEVVYHDASKVFKNFSNAAEYKPTHLNPLAEYKPTHLNPLMKDTDGNGVNDAAEDFDKDGFTNLVEQVKGTNPHVK